MYKTYYIIRWIKFFFGSDSLSKEAFPSFSSLFFICLALNSSRTILNWHVFIQNKYYRSSNTQYYLTLSFIRNRLTIYNRTENSKHDLFMTALLFQLMPQTSRIWDQSYCQLLTALIDFPKVIGKNILEIIIMTYSSSSTPETRFSELLDLMNKLQLTVSYFTLYQDSIQ